MGGVRFALGDDGEDLGVAVRYRPLRQVGNMKKRKEKSGDDGGKSEKKGEQITPAILALDLLETRRQDWTTSNKHHRHACLALCRQRDNIPVYGTAG